MRPWNEENAQTTSCLPRPPNLRASLMAASFDSAPELQKNVWYRDASAFPWRRSSSSATATSQPGSVPNRFDTWHRVRACSAIASATTGLAWPSDTTASPDRKSRWRLPSPSQSSVPWPRTKRTWGAP